MVMKRVIARALEELTEASQFPQRTESHSSELYDLSDFVTRRPFRPEASGESMIPGDERSPRPRVTAAKEMIRSPRWPRRAGVLGMLATKRGVQQALILQEIIGPPRALRPWHEER